MKLLMRDEAKGREHTIFVTIFSALMVMLAIVVMLMASATAISGVTLQLDENAVDILDKQVEKRAGYIQDQLQQAQELTDLSTYINETTQQMLDDETLSLKTLDSSSSDSLPLLQAAAPRMLETLRSKRISGIFLILNTHDFTGRTSGDRLPCVYLRDLDPDAAPSVVNSDILLECAPSELVQTFDIATDKAWSPALQYLDGEQDVFYVRPFQTAYEDDERMGAANYGRWTTLPYKLLGDDREAIAYAQPLILDDGTVYGVLGVELLESYMDTKLPWDELQSDHHGSYLLASTTSDLRGEVLALHVTSNTGEQSVPLRNAKWELTLQRSNNCWYYMMNGKQQIASIRQIGLYSRNAPFSGERWLLVGVVGGNDLFSFSQSVTKLLGLAVLLTLGIGLACAFFVSYGLAQPVAQLSKELMDAQEQRKAVPEFSRTGIRELDQLAEAIVTLSTDNYKAAVAERSRIEHERDYDALTGLYSRQAFFRVCGELFEKPDTLRHAALMTTSRPSTTLMATTGVTFICGRRPTAYSRARPAALWWPAFPATSSCCCSTAMRRGRPCGRTSKSWKRTLPRAVLLCRTARDCASGCPAAWHGIRRMRWTSKPSRSMRTLQCMKSSTRPRARYGSSTWSATAPVSMRWSSAATLKSSSGSGGWTTTSSPSSRLTTAMWWPTRP